MGERQDATGEKDGMLSCIEEAVSRSKTRDHPLALTIGEAREAMRLWGEREYERGYNNRVDEECSKLKRKH